MYKSDVHIELKKEIQITSIWIILDLILKINDVTHINQDLYGLILCLVCKIDVCDIWVTTIIL